MILTDYYMFVRKKMFVLIGAADAAACKKQVQKGNKGPALLALTASVGNSIVANMLAMKSTSRSIDGDTHALATDQDGGASATTGGGESFKRNNQHPTSTTLNDGCELNNVVDNDDEEVEVDKMPTDWTFPDVITFALLGPIVPPALMPYRSEIMMPTLPRTVPGNITNGQAEKRKEKLGSKSLKKNSSGSPSKAPAEVSLQQKIMVAGIAQSQMLMEQRQKNRANN
jgi:hypothetical protein